MKKEKKPANDEIIHIKLNYQEAIKSKKDILETQRNLIQLLRTVKRFHLIRIEELKFKLMLLKRIKETKTNISKLNKTLPKIKIPDIIKENVEELHKKKEKKEDIFGQDMTQSDIEKELMELQIKLKQLE